MFEILGAAIKVISAVNTGFTLYKNIKEALTGVSLKGNYAGNAKPELLTPHLYKVPERELTDLDRSLQITFDDRSLITQSMIGIQQRDKNDLIISQPIIIPDRFQKVLMYPEEILHGITQLEQYYMQGGLMRDKTFKPVIYNKDNMEYVGWMKIGYAKEFLGVDYHPLSGNSGGNNDAYELLKIVEPLLNLLEGKVYTYRPIGILPGAYDMVLRNQRPTDQPDNCVAVYFNDKMNWGILFTTEYFLFLIPQTAFRRYDTLHQFDIDLGGKGIVIKNGVSRQDWDIWLPFTTQPLHQTTIVWDLLRKVKDYSISKFGTSKAAGMDKDVISYKT